MQGVWRNKNLYVSKALTFFTISSCFPEAIQEYCKIELKNRRHALEIGKELKLQLGLTKRTPPH